jgi:protein TonB
MTSLSLPVARRRFLAMLWLSAALHAVVIGLTRLPPPLVVTPPPELQVQLAQPAPTVQPPVALPQTEPTLKPPRPLPPAPQALPQPVLPQPIAASPQAVPAPVPAAPVVAPSREAPGPQLNIPLVVDSRYYTAKELDVPPSSTKKPDPVYPPQAEEQGVSGRVLIRLHVEADGSISKTEVVSVTPGGVFGELFKKSTLDSVRATHFRPALRNGQPVRAVVEIPVVFEPEN